MKISKFQRNKRNLQETLLSTSNLSKSAAEVQHIIIEIYDEAFISERRYPEWFQQFKNDDLGVEGKKSPEIVKNLEDAELEALLKDDSWQIQ